MIFTNAAIGINLARDIALNYLSQQNPARNFTTASKLLVHLSKRRHL